MATLSNGYPFGATETVTNTKLTDLVDDATISGIVNSDVSSSAAIASSKINYDSSGIPTVGATQTWTGYNTFTGNVDITGQFKDVFKAIRIYPNGQAAARINIDIQATVRSDGFWCVDVVTGASDVSIKGVVRGRTASSASSGAVNAVGLTRGVIQIDSATSYNGINLDTGTNYVNVQGCVLSGSTVPMQITDGVNLNGKIRDNIGYTAPGDIITIKKAIDHADIVDGGGATGYADFADAIPAGCIIKAVKFDYPEAFNSDNTTTLTIMAGLQADLDAFNKTADP